MKQAIVCTVLIAATIFSNAQGSSLPERNRISLQIVSQPIVVISPASYSQIIEDIKDVAGIRSKFIVEEAEVDNIEATISHRKKYILYNADFMKQINNATKDKWATVALLAHEIGHHIKGHTSKRAKNNRLKYELEADEFAGYVLQKLGASLAQSQLVMKYIARTNPSTTHPARSDRMDAIEKGWNAAAGMNPGYVQAR
jgi:hypothetical protein